MGCDIHVVAQAKVGGKWRDVHAQPENLRNYPTFSIYAGVRSYEASDPISPPRGYPDDFEEPPMFWADHSFSWLGAQEIMDKWDSMSEADREECPLMRSHVAFFSDCMDCIPCDAADLRIVFGFDS